jgi:hypothetical protein
VRAIPLGIGLLAAPFVLLSAKSLAPPSVVHGAPSPDAPTYTKDGSLIVPQDYREWVFLTSGVNMTYGPNSDMGHTMFDNVFVNRESYRSFLASGTWPDKTVMVLETRMADTNPSINHGGHSQAVEKMGVELHVKDTARFNGGWAFFAVTDSGLGKQIPQPAPCYTCHTEHAAVDTTFVQFYPTLLPIARSKGTLSAAYLKEFGTAGASK